MLREAIYNSPPWLVGLILALIGFTFAALCVLVVRRTTSSEMLERHSELINLTVTNIALLYGVLLAFLAVAVWDGFTKASESASREAALVANLYSDTQGMAPPLAADLRGHVMDYLHQVIEVEWPMQARGQIPPDTELALRRLHRHVAVLTPGDTGDTVLMGDMLRSINELDSARAARLDGLGGHIPGLIWTLIVAMGFLTVGLVTFLKADSLVLQATMLGSLVLAIVIVLVMIVELDNPFRGSIGISAEAYAHVLSQVEAPVTGDDSD